MTAAPRSPAAPTPSAAPTAALAEAVSGERWRPSPPTVNRLALFALITNIAIVASGGLVRLTGSGLGCPSWPNCADGSVVPTRELSWHKYVEFGNRLFTYVVLVAAVAVLIAVLRERPRRPQLRLWAWLVFLAVPAQAVMGGITVLTHLNPWAVAAHFVLSMLLVAAATVLWWRTRPHTLPPAEASAPVHPLLVRLGWVTWLLTYAVFCVGTVVTGAGPHAGDPTAKRIAVKPGSVAQLHADLVMLLVGTSFALAVAVTAVGAQRVVRTTTRLLLAALAFQAAVGFAQYFDKLPIGLVELHLFGAALIAAAATAVVLALMPPRQVTPR
jgi:cytochrome c oxidase assembly protein subunit 15